VNLVACEWSRTKLEAYVDGELSRADEAALGDHLRSCASCASAALDLMQLKRAIATAGKRYEPGAALRAKVLSSIAPKLPRKSRWQWALVAAPALVVLIASLLVNFYAERERNRRQQLFSELTDLHIATLASATPVDVLSSDRHTVKPWFEGKIPFTFNLPELQDSQFTLLGARVTYLEQTPGAQLIYQLRKHQISVFIFQDRGERTASLPSGPLSTMSFTFENWKQSGLRYFVVGDVGPDDIEALSKLLKAAG